MGKDNLGDNLYKKKKIRSIYASIKLGLVVQQHHSYVKDDYLKGKSLTEIVEQRSMNKVLGCSETIARNAVWYAIRGHHLDYKPYNQIPHYEGLVNQEVLDKVALEHKKDNAYRLNKWMDKNKKGIRGMSKEDHFELSSKGGKRLKELGKGIMGFSYEERRNNGIKSIRKKGFKEWSDEEKYELVDILTDPNRDYWNGQKLKPNIKEEIARMLNEKYHGSDQVRNLNSVNVMIYRITKGRVKF
jgi:hypothetical protein